MIVVRILCQGIVYDMDPNLTNASGYVYNHRICVVTAIVYSVLEMCGNSMPQLIVNSEVVGTC